MADEVMVKEENTQVAIVEQKADLLANPFSSTHAFQENFDMAKMLASSELVPENYQGKPMNCLIALEQSQRMGCSPLMVMQNLYIVKGKPSWSGQACAMIVKGCGLFDKVKLVYVGKEGQDDWGAYVTAIDKDGEVVKGTTVTIKMAKDEGWYGKNPKWKNLPEQMLAYRAYAFFARVHCPNALNGFAVEGEPEDIAKEKKSNITEILMNEV